MGRKCSICEHPQRDEIDKQLLHGDLVSEISLKFGVSDRALYRHAKSHVPELLAKASRANEVARADNLLAELKSFRERTIRLLDMAEQAGTTRAYGSPAQYLKEIREQIKLLAELEGRIAAQPQTNINVLFNNPEWIEVQRRIIEALEQYPQAKEAVIRAFSGRV